MTEQEYNERQELRRVRTNEKIKLQALGKCYREAYAFAIAAGADPEAAGDHAHAKRLSLKATMQEQS